MTSFSLVIIHAHHLYYSKIKTYSQVQILIKKRAKQKTANNRKMVQVPFKLIKLMMILILSKGGAQGINLHLLSANITQIKRAVKSTE